MARIVSDAINPEKSLFLFSAFLLGRLMALRRSVSGVIIHLRAKTGGLFLQLLLLLGGCICPRLLLVGCLAISLRSFGWGRLGWRLRPMWNVAANQGKTAPHNTTIHDILQCYNTTILKHKNTTMLQYYNATMLLCYNTTTLQFAVLLAGQSVGGWTSWWLGWVDGCVGWSSSRSRGCWVGWVVDGSPDGWVGR